MMMMMIFNLEGSFLGLALVLLKATGGLPFVNFRVSWDYLRCMQVGPNVVMKKKKKNDGDDF